jgi:AcrR family transcriptional regulator
VTEIRPRGRRPGETKTREAILEAARNSFARAGYDRTTIRQIAAEADVDPALVMHFFATKHDLFDAAMDLPFDAEAAVAAMLADADPDGLGEAFVRMFFSIWEDPQTGPRMIGLIRSAASYELAAERVRHLLHTRILHPLATALDTSEPELRSELASSQLVGIGLARYVLCFEPLASTDVETLIAALAPAVQRYLTGPLDRRPR